MKKLLPVFAAGAIAAALALTPAVMASAAPVQAAATTAKHYTLSVTGNGKHASVVWTTATVKGTTATPTVHTAPKAKEPWKKHVKPGADLYEVVAIQTTGSTLSCEIKNTHGTVIAHSTSHGKNTIVTCIVTTKASLAAPTSGSTSS